MFKCLSVLFCIVTLLYSFHAHATFKNVFEILPSETAHFKLNIKDVKDLNHRFLDMIDPLSTPKGAHNPDNLNIAVLLEYDVEYEPLYSGHNQIDFTHVSILGIMAAYSPLTGNIIATKTLRPISKTVMAKFDHPQMGSYISEAVLQSRKEIIKKISKIRNRMRKIQINELHGRVITNEIPKVHFKSGNIVQVVQEKKGKKFNLSCRMMTFYQGYVTISCPSDFLGSVNAYYWAPIGLQQKSILLENISYDPIVLDAGIFNQDDLKHESEFLGFETIHYLSSLNYLVNLPKENTISSRLERKLFNIFADENALSLSLPQRPAYRNFSASLKLSLKIEHLKSQKQTNDVYYRQSYGTLISLEREQGGIRFSSIATQPEKQSFLISNGDVQHSKLTARHSLFNASKCVINHLFNIENKGDLICMEK